MTKTKKIIIPGVKLTPRSSIICMARKNLT